MATLQQQYKINGVLDTNNSVFENIEQLGLSSGCWITYDIHDGRWSVIINRAGDSTASFDDSNIIGSIAINSTGLTDFYNSVKVIYARADINDQLDFVEVNTPEFKRLANEPDNVLEISLPLVTNPVQALQIGSIELKQSRVNKVITFVTDYSAISINAGDLIDVTNAALGWVNEIFRVITIRESDQDNGSIAIEITGLEYDPDVYVNDLVQFDRSAENQITTIGNINTPAPPVLQAVSRDNRPHLTITGVVPSGLVAGMEFWTSRDNVNYSLAATERPAAGGAFVAGETVSYDADNLDPGAVFGKVRAINSQTSSSFSGDNNVDYQPVYVAGVVEPNTGITDANGNVLTTLTITELLSLVDGLKADGDSGAGSLFESIFNTFETDTGVNIVNQSQIVQGTTVGETFNAEVSSSVTEQKLNAASATTLVNNIYDQNNQNNRNNWIAAPALTLPGNQYNALNVDIRTPTCRQSYDFLDQNNTIRTARITAQPSFFVRILFSAPGEPIDIETATIVESSTVDWSTNFARATVTADPNVSEFIPAGTYYVALQPLESYDLSMFWPVRPAPDEPGAINLSAAPGVIFFYNFEAQTGTTFTLTGLRTA